MSDSRTRVWALWAVLAATAGFSGAQAQALKSYSYDPHGQVAKATTSAQIVTYNYDLAANRASVVAAAPPPMLLAAPAESQSVRLEPSIPATLAAPPSDTPKLSNSPRQTPSIQRPRLGAPPAAQPSNR